MRKENFKEENPYWKRISEMSEKQREKGIKKYGIPLERFRLKKRDRIRYIEEELIDALMYMEWLKDKMSDKEEDGE